MQLSAMNFSINATNQGFGYFHIWIAIFRVHKVNQSIVNGLILSSVNSLREQRQPINLFGFAFQK